MNGWVHSPEHQFHNFERSLDLGAREAVASFTARPLSCNEIDHDNLLCCHRYVLDSSHS